MTRRAIVVLLTIQTAGCFAMIEGSLRTISSQETGCPEDRVVVTDYSQGVAGIGPSTWRTSACDREYRCELYVAAAGTGIPPRQSCAETDFSKQRTYRKIVTDRLALETGCQASNVKILSQSEWSRGTETAYRMDACGKPYVCTTAAGRTDCKAALDSGPTSP